MRINLQRWFESGPCRQGRKSLCGSVLILVLWVAFGLVVLSIYFANSMSFELRAADNRAASLAAEHAIRGAVRYVNYYLENYATNGMMPELRDYLSEEVPVGESTFWLLGRGDGQRVQTEAVFGLVDEASKLNLNTATAAMLEALPGMTPQLAAAIVDWRDSDSNPSENGAEDEIYQRLQPPRKCKNAPFESVEELRLVAGAELEILYGEDLNLNGVLDPNENDGDTSPPFDNRDGRLDPGILEYVTVYSQQPNSGRINVSTGRQQLQQLLQQKFGNERASEITRALNNAQNMRSVLEFYIRSRMTAEEFAQIHTNLTASTGATVQGLVNVNTASEAVLACIPGIGPEKAGSVVAFRISNPTRLDSVAWVSEVLDQESAIQAGRYLTGSTYQFSVDVVATGRHGRGMRRIRHVIDTSGTEPRIAFQRELTQLGWPLGVETRENLLMSLDKRR